MVKSSIELNYGLTRRYRVYRLLRLFNPSLRLYCGVEPLERVPQVCGDVTLPSHTARSHPALALPRQKKTEASKPELLPAWQLRKSVGTGKSGVLIDLGTPSTDNATQSWPRRAARDASTRGWRV